MEVGYDFAMTNGSARRTRLTRAESKENTRRLLIHAAERVFMRQGYQRATLDNIAGDAGFTLAKGIALTRQTRPSTKPPSTKLIKILLGVPAEI